jgi:hypothetical protein
MESSLSEEVGSLNTLEGSLGGVAHCGLGNFPVCGLYLGAGRAALGFEGVLSVDFEPMDFL